MKVLSSLTPREERLRAYLNISQPPKGFIGGAPLVEGIEGKITPKDIHLANYAAIYSTILKILGFTHPLSELSGFKLIPRGYVRSDLSDSRDDLDLRGNFDDALVSRYLTNYVCTRLKLEPDYVPKALERNSIVYIHMVEFYRKAVIRYLYEAELWFSELSKSISPIELFKNSEIYARIFSDLRRTLAALRSEKGELSNDESIAFEILDRMLFLHEHFQKSTLPAQGKSYNSRLFFSEDVQRVWHSNRSIGIPSSKAWQYGDAVADTPSNRFSTALRISSRYGFSGNVEFYGERFHVEFSPFSLKPSLSSGYDLELAIYPTSDAVSLLLRHFTDPTFEHADGAVAIACLTIVGDKVLVIRELQTDVFDLIRNAGHNVSDFSIPALLQWRELVLHTVRKYAKMHGFTELYSSTPFAIFERYANSIHPIKASEIYYRFMKRAGGTLVFDDLGQVSVPSQHYWQLKL